MRILVCGGRVGVSQKAVEAVLDALAPLCSNPLTVIHGDAKQTDRFAGAWARRAGHLEIPYPINPALDGHNINAPTMRNWRMAEEKPDVVVAFPGGPGTRHMINVAKAKKILIWDVEFRDGQFNVYEWHSGPQGQARLVISGNY